MRAFLLTISLVALAPAVCAEPTPGNATPSGPTVVRSGDHPAARHGDHPALVARRVIDAQGYDYASKFYPHPAWLYLSAQPPSDAYAAAAHDLAGEPVAATAAEHLPHAR